MERVLIVGAPGAGKSTFARELQSRTDLPIVHLDSIFFDPTADYQANQNQWQEKMDELVGKDKWIIEGSHIVDFGERGARADTAFFLDYSGQVVLSRLLKRMIIQRQKDAPEMPEGWRSVNNTSFRVWLFRVVLGFRSTYGERLEKIFRAVPNRNVHVFKKPKEAAEYLRKAKTAN